MRHEGHKGGIVKSAGSGAPVTHVDLDVLRNALESVAQRCDVAARLQSDPVGVVRRFEREHERELVGILAASLAFGNVKALRASVERAVARLGPQMLAVLDNPDLARDRLRGTGHRMVRDVDITRLLVGARSVQRKYGSLGARFAYWLSASHGELRQALAQWTGELRQAAGLHPDPKRKGPQHILPDPLGTSGCKRLFLYLRWMVRPDDGVDLGLWSAVSPSVLLIPLDTHILRLARNLGLTRRASASWLAAEEVTAVLRAIDPADPVRFDFALCHMGMLQGCPSRRDLALCAGCGVMAVCRHWPAGPAASEGAAAPYPPGGRYPAVI